MKAAVLFIFTLVVSFVLIHQMISILNGFITAALGSLR